MRINPSPSAHISLHAIYLQSDQKLAAFLLHFDKGAAGYEIFELLMCRLVRWFMCVCVCACTQSCSRMIYVAHEPHRRALVSRVKRCK